MTPYYEDEAVTIYHGDCVDVLADLPGSSVDCVVTSPPYNQLGSRIRKDPGGMHRGNQWLSKVVDNGYADDMDEDEYQAWQQAVGTLLGRVVRPGGSLFYNHKLRYRESVPIHPLDIVRGFDGWTLRQEVVWDRRRAMAFNARMFAPSDERIYWLVRDGADHEWNQEAASYLSVWAVPPPIEKGGHPCPFPVGLPTRCIAAVTAEGDTVLDPFMGAGTTLRAAVDAGRRAIGIEAEESYCEIAVERLAQTSLFGGAA